MLFILYDDSVAILCVTWYECIIFFTVAIFSFHKIHSLWTRFVSFFFDCEGGLGAMAAATALDLQVQIEPPLSPREKAGCEGWAVWAKGGRRGGTDGYILYTVYLCCSIIFFLDENCSR